MMASQRHVAVVIQARMSSTRLPGKVLLPVAGAAMLQRMIERVRAATTPFDIVVATTQDDSDDIIARLADDLDLACYRGHATNLLQRHIGAARMVGADIVAKVPSDCPLIDPRVIDRVLATHLAGNADYTSNLHPQSYPDGNDVEAMSLDVLLTAAREATAPHELEHTTPFIWDRPERFRIDNVTWETGLDYSRSHRLTVDYVEDYELVRSVFAELYEPGYVFGIEAILELLAARPDIAQLNARYRGSNWYRHHLDVLKTVRASDTRFIEQGA